MKKLVLIVVWILFGLVLFVSGEPARAWLDEGCAHVADNCCDGTAGDPDCTIAGGRCGSCPGVTKPSDHCCTGSGGCNVEVRTSSGTSTEHIDQWDFVYDRA